MFVFRKTSEDWCGNFGENKDLVKISCFHTSRGFCTNNKYFGCFCRIVVEGNDDTMMILDYEYHDKESKRIADRNTMEMFNEVININNITFKKLLIRGFEWF